LLLELGAQALLLLPELGGESAPKSTWRMGQ
jgi:hypothetical protein